MTRLGLAACVPLVFASACGGNETTPHEHEIPDGGAVAPERDVAIAEDAGAPDVRPESGVRNDRFATQVTSFTKGACGGFGERALPDVVSGPPKGVGSSAGSLDVLSLGIGGSVVVAFGDNAIVDGPGPDFIVFENAFYRGGTGELFAEPGEVSVSENGDNWFTFPCAPASPPYSGCAGVRPVFSNPESGIEPFDATLAGGDPFDLSAVGLTSARFVRIHDKSSLTCPDAGRVENLGFDLDAVAVVNARIR